MTSSTRVEDLEPLSPELVLVSSPELAQLAREQLSSQAAAVATRERDERSGAPAYQPPPAPPRPLPPPYPRPTIVQPAPEPEQPRRRTRAVAIAVGIAALAAAGGAAALAWGHFLSKDARSPGLPRSEARVASVAAPGAPAGTAAARAKTPPAVTAHPNRPRKAPRKQPRKATAAKPARKPTPAKAPRKPAPAKPPIAAGTGVFVPARTWEWSTSKGASAYLVRFFLNGREVFKARTVKNRIVLPRSFRFAAGRYRWTVLPVKGPASGQVYGRAIVDSHFVLTPAVAVQANRG